MRKQLLFLKTLLVAVLLGVGTSAWATDVPYNVGESTSATYLSSYSDVWTMTSDGILTVTFTNHCVTSNANHFNWHLICGNADDSPSVGDVNTNRYFVMRADRWDNVAGNADNFYNVSSNYFSDFMASQDGATVTLKIVRVGTSIRVYTTAVKDEKTYRMSYYYTLASSTATTKFYLTGSLSYMTVTAVSQTDEVAGNVTTNVDIDFDNNCTATIQAANNTSTDNVITGVASEFRWKGVYNTLPAVSDGMLRVGNAASKVALTGDEAGSKDIVTISFDLGMVALSNNKELRFWVYDTDGTAIIEEKYYCYGGKVVSSTFGLKDLTEYLYSSGVNNPGMSACKNTITITLNYETQKMKLSINNSKTGSPFEHEIDMPSGMKAVGSFAVGSNYGSGSDARRSYFDNLLITTTLGDYSTTKTITYAYQDQDGNDITDLVVSKGGTASATPEKNATYTPVYPASFVDDDYAYDYTYTSGGGSFTVTTDATITLVYTKSAHATTDVKVQYKYDDDVIKEEVVAEAYPVGKPLSYGVHQYVLGDDGTFYQTSQGGSNYYYRTNAAAATIAESLSLSDINNVVYFTEAEDVSEATTTVTQTSRCSMGKLGYTGGSAAYEEVTTLAPGKYQIYWRAYNGNNSDRTGNFKVGESGDAMEYTQTKSTTSTGNTAEFTVLTSSKLYWGSAGSSNLGGTDWFYVVKTGDVVNFTLGADAGDSYKSYVTKGNTDFATLGVTAYIAKAADTTNGEVTLSTIATAPANTPVLLKGTKGGYAAISTTTTSYDAPETNYLKAADGETAIGSNDAKYVLAYDNGWEFRHYNGTLSAGKVYLDLSTMGARATKFSFVFDDKTTGISDTTRLKDKGQMTNGVFNLKGQRVKKAAKGLYIVNGKKYVK